MSCPFVRAASAALALSAAGLPLGAQQSLLAFATVVDGQWDLFGWDPDGTDPPRQLTSTPIDERQPALSGDRELVAYTDSAGHAWIQRIEGGERTRVNTVDERGLFLSPSLNATGTAALFALREDAGHDVTDVLLLELEPLGLGTKAQIVLAENPHHGLAVGVVDVGGRHRNVHPDTIHFRIGAIP